MKYQQQQQLTPFQKQAIFQFICRSYMKAAAAAARGLKVKMMTIKDGRRHSI